MTTSAFSSASPGALADTYSRTALALVHDGSATSLQDAQDKLHGAAVRIRVGRTACRTTGGQAAALTAVATLSRTFGTVMLDLADPSCDVQTGPYRDRTLDDAVAQAHVKGAISPHGTAAPLVDILIGDTPPTEEGPRSAAATVRAGWKGWTASSGPRAPVHCVEGHPLAGVVSAALAATEAFAVLRGTPGAAARTHTVDLWSPLRTSHTSAPPRLGLLAPAWHLVGLGHLGQAAAWCLSFLPYRRHDLKVTLQDVDIAVEANLSTGVFSTAAEITRRKTRIVADRLDLVGADTIILEQRLDRRFRRAPHEPGVAVVGVDNPVTRQLLDLPGWDLAVDLGLGSDHRSFTTIAMHCIDRTHRADDIAAWRVPPSRPVPGALPSVAAFDAYRDATPAERCGLVDLAGRAVGASFVGVLAAGLGVNEVLRRLAGAPGTAVLSLDAGRPDHLRGADASATPHLTAVDCR